MPTQTEDWKLCYEFFQDLDDVDLLGYLEQVDSCDHFHINSPMESQHKEIDVKKDPWWREYSRLKFEKEFLFSKTQVDLFGENLSQMKTIIEAFFSASEFSTPSILQFIFAFDPEWVKRFVVINLIKHAEGELKDLLFVKDEENSVGASSFPQLPG